MVVSKYVKKEILDLVVLGVYVTLTLGIFSLLFGFGLGGFEREDILAKNNFYIPYGIIFFLVGIVGLKVAGILVFGEKHANKEGVVVHDPEQSFLGGFLVFRNPFLLAFFSIIVFSLIFWAFTNQQTFFNAVPQYEQQFTTGADLFFSVYPASPSETLGALFVISLLGFVLGFMVLKNKLSKVLFLVLFIPGATIVSAIYGFFNHLARYGFDDVAITNVIIFWGAGGFFTAITGSVIPFLIMHDLNNFFFRLSRLFSNDVVTAVTFISIGILTLVFLLFFIRARKKHKEGKDREKIT